jgi:replicative DNA helicase
VPLAAIRAFADQLEDQALRRQLDNTVEACREEARKKATALREELARLETELAALDD